MRQLDISWRGTFGQYGRLQTSMLSRKTVQPDPFILTPLPVEGGPPAYPTERQFSIQCRITNTTLARQNIRIQSIKQRMGSCLVSGNADTDVGVIEAGQSVDFSLDFFPLVQGVLKITGLRVLDLISGTDLDIDCLCDVFVY